MPLTAGQDPASDADPQVGAAARAAARLARQVTISLGEVDLSLPQYRVLAFLDEGEAAPSDLAGRLGGSDGLPEAGQAGDQDAGVTGVHVGSDGD